MKAVNYFVVIDKIKQEEKKTSGLIMTENTNDDIRYFKGNVISVGNLVEIVKKNDIIYYDAIAGHNISYNDDMYRVIRSRDIVLVE